ncbi:hypothetical protein RUM43_012087 [Polyplax serrata]|uniref:Uncharacterized protein n=1 Tax=Polyplax serrata TaxID=468196 RepID=A0AAN8PJA2_POLSC
MPKTLKNQNSGKKSGDDQLARLIMDFFMLSTLMNGIMCTSHHMTSNNLGMFEDKTTNSLEQVYYAVPYTTDKSFQKRTSSNTSTTFFNRILQWILDKEPTTVNRLREQRSFRFGHRFVGHRKRLQFALLPIMYKMGVMTTLLTGLTVLALKGLTIGLILLFFALGNHFLKYSKQWKPSSSQQPIHVHVHSPDAPDKVVKYHNYESEGHYGPWDREEVQEEYPQAYDSGWRNYRKRPVKSSGKTVQYE